MKKYNPFFKLTTLSSSLLIGLATISSSHANTYTDAACTTTDDSNLTITTTCDKNLEAKGYIYNSLTNVTETNAIFNLDNSNLVIDVDAAGKYGIGHTTTFALDDQEHNFTANLTNFKSIKSTNDSAIGITTGDWNNNTQKLNTTINLTGNNSAVIEGYSDNTNKNISYRRDEATALRVISYGAGNFNVNLTNPNITYKGTAIGEGKGPSLETIVLDNYKNNSALNNVNVNFTGKIFTVNDSNLGGTGFQYAEGSSGAVTARNINIKDSHIITHTNVTATSDKYENRGVEINLNSEDLANGLVTESNIVFENSNIYAVGNKNNNIAARITTRNNNNSVTNITQKGGILAAGDLNTGSLENPDVKKATKTSKATEKLNAFALRLIANTNNGQINFKQEAGEVKIATAGTFLESHAIYMEANNAALTQEAAGKITVENFKTSTELPHTSAIGINATNANIDLKGTIKSDGYAFYAYRNSKANIHIHDNATIQSSYLISDEGSSNNITIDKAKLTVSKFELKDGEDTLTLNGTNIDNIFLIQGGNESSNSSLANYDVLNLNNYDNLDLYHFSEWERINLNQGTYVLNKNLDVGKGSYTLKTTTNNDPRGGLFINNSTLNVNPNALGIDWLSGGDTITISGDVFNKDKSVINLRQDGDGKFIKVKITGDYHGDGGTIEMNTELAGNDANTDRLIIEGNVTGNTVVKVKQKGGEGAAATDGIKLIQLSATSQVAEDAFSLEGNSVQAGGYTYNLTYKDDSNKGFYLSNDGVERAVVTPPTTTDQSSTSKNPQLNDSLNGYDYLRALRSNQALTVFNSSNLFFDHKNDKGFNVSLGSSYSTNKGNYNRLTFSHSNGTVRSSASINYGTDSWENYTNKAKSKAKTLGFTGEVAYHHADDFIFALNLDYGHHKNDVKRTYALLGKDHTFFNTFENNSLELSLRLAKDFNFAHSSVTPYFLLAVQNNSVKGFTEDFGAVTKDAVAYEKLSLVTNKHNYTTTRPEVGFLTNTDFNSVLSLKTAFFYSYLPKTDFDSYLVAKEAGKDAIKVAENFSYKADHLFAARLALVTNFTKNLSLTVEAQANKVTSLKKVKGSVSAALKYNF